ncbi:hypothetical protein BGW36DRAFT_293720 [Talaromyces proteolyticus]|uniref:Uncharacterized protein n=1 Tax=Talaromyces proteolyticus TaxID=1131652 RepID=A0AAD4Q1H8_9EURO|nr:uncharacterized protein BGW36DRAFT_293720 [Talaromyces proteolyticus]KAH8698729.1 hypothetical protein BGW36DRAFT_293720 [Talaromyces proteolyticus]
MLSSLDVRAFRQYIPPRDTQRSRELANSDAYQWANIRCAEPFMEKWMSTWKELYMEPYRGITTDGKVQPDLFPLAIPGQDRGAPTAAMVDAARRLLSAVSPVQKAILVHPIGAPEWRSWANPEIYIFKHGLRLEEVNENIIMRVYDLMKASLSRSGYAKARGCMKVNAFLGEVVDGTKVLNEHSYNLLLFGTPSLTLPWGWQLYGHHLCINCFVLASQVVISPVFMGAEPNIIDEGPDQGTVLFAEQEALGVSLVRSFDKQLYERVQIYQELSSPPIPSSRFHRADQRHLGGAFHDNRVIPYEGVRCSLFSPSQQEHLRGIIRLTLDYLPPKALSARMEDISTHWDQTYFCWIGGTDPGRPFYYKVHSPVVMIEFDHHTGVFLNNTEPQPFHIHTLVRTPNGNDYGKELLRQFERLHKP